MVGYAKGLVGKELFTRLFSAAILLPSSIFIILRSAMYPVVYKLTTEVHEIQILTRTSRENFCLASRSLDPSLIY